MNDKPGKKDDLEVSSTQLKAELIEIKERVGALETIASISNRAAVEAYVRSNVKTDKARQILKECEEPRTVEYLKTKFGFASAQALHHHLNPLRESDLVCQRFADDGKLLAFEWSKLFKGLPKATIRKILDGSS